MTDPEDYEDFWHPTAPPMKPWKRYGIAVVVFALLLIVARLLREWT